MVQAAAQDERLAAVVSEGAGTRSFPEELEEYTAVEVALNLPLLALKTAAVGVFSNTAVPPKLTDLIPRIAPRPTMFIWAPNGGNVEWMNPTYTRLAGANSSIWEIDDGSHIRGLAGHPEEYESASWASSTQPCLKLSGERPIDDPRRMQRRPRDRTRTWAFVRPSAASMLRSARMVSQRHPTTFGVSQDSSRVPWHATTSCRP